MYSFLSRVVTIGLTYAQPYLMTSLIGYVGMETPRRNDGYGLIGAFALVFTMKAVMSFNTLA